MVLGDDHADPRALLASLAVLEVTTTTTTQGSGSSGSGGSSNNNNDYVIVLDRSGSMQGARRANLLAGLRALLQLLPATTTTTTDVTLVAFNERASVVYGPGTAEGAMAEWERIADALQAGGGTSLEAALTVALEVAEGKLQRGRPVVMLLLTDGEDPDFAQNMRRFRAAGVVPSSPKSEAVLRQLGQRSGLATHFVGICGDADAGLLDGLAQQSNGTFVSIADDNIKGLMGSLLGLVAEKVSHGVLVSVVHAASDTVVMAPRAIHLRRGTPTRVPLELPLHLLVAADHHQKLLRLRLEVVRIGARLDAPPANAIECTVDVEEEEGGGGGGVAVKEKEEEDWGVALEHARAWRGRACATMAGALTRRTRYEDTTNEALETNTALLARLQPLLLLAAATEVAGEEAQALRALVAEVEVHGAELDAARSDHHRLRELSCRAASDASTARNGGISIGDARTESVAQASMRSMSLLY
jgi:Mg-chelatase subunit ChlD